jgi:putative ABC transport system ATP-binding protein
MTDLSKVFVTDEVETHALTNLNLTIQQGEFVSIAGPSGCGKSTLLSIIGLLDGPTSGSYCLNGQPAAGHSARERARIRSSAIGFVFQDFNLIGDLTVFENVVLPLTYQETTSKERRARALEALSWVGMEHRRNHFPAQLSGGQQQRAAVARALVSEPVLLLADEPTGNLDSRNAETVMELLQSLHEKSTTICMVTHDPRFARYAERTIHLFDGRIVDDGPATIA